MNITYYEHPAVGSTTRTAVISILIKSDKNKLSKNHLQVFYINTYVDTRKIKLNTAHGMTPHQRDVCFDGKKPRLTVTNYAGGLLQGRTR